MVLSALSAFVSDFMSEQPYFIPRTNAPNGGLASLALFWLAVIFVALSRVNISPSLTTSSSFLFVGVVARSLQPKAFRHSPCSAVSVIAVVHDTARPRDRLHQYAVLE
jgi:hypothetical protein